MRCVFLFSCFPVFLSLIFFSFSFLTPPSLPSNLSRKSIPAYQTDLKKRTRTLKQQVRTFVSRYMPGYELFGDGVSDPARRWSGKGLKLKVGREREVVGVQTF